MATQEVIDGLTQTIQDCLEAKLQAGFDANAALTVDIAREVANAVEDKANEYTDIEISKVMTLITGGEVDLGPFTEFMNTIKTLLDGDETTEGYQVFNTLISDTAANKQLLISHTTTIQSIQNTLTTFQSTLADHETRIAALEAAQHEPMECEDCHDEILNLVKGSMAAACTAADTTLTTHYASEHSSVLAAFVAEMNPVVASFSGQVISETAPGADDGIHNAFSVGYPTATYVRLTTPADDWHNLAPVSGQDGDFTLQFAEPLSNGVYLFELMDAQNNVLASDSVTHTVATSGA